MDRFPQIDHPKMREVRCPSDPQSTCKSTFGGREEAACVARLPPSPSFSLIPQSRLPRPITENPSIPPSSLPISLLRTPSRRPPLPQHPTVRTAALVGRSLARLVARSRCGHPSIQFMRKNGEGAGEGGHACLPS